MPYSVGHAALALHCKTRSLRGCWTRSAHLGKAVWTRLGSKRRMRRLSVEGERGQCRILPNIGENRQTGGCHRVDEREEQGKSLIHLQRSHASHILALKMQIEPYRQFAVCGFA